MTPGALRDLGGRAVTVMGLGLQGGGVELVRFLAMQGARITVTDQRPAEKLAESLQAIAGIEVELVLGGHRTEDFTSAEVVVANPAVAPSHPLLRAARRAGAWVTSEMALFLERSPARVVLITGTQGKSSTANAAAQLVEAGGRRVHLGGNIGHALIAELDRMRPEDVAVVEISSYQLEALPSAFGPLANVAAVACVNVLADHLERHGSIEGYEAAKRRVLELAGDSAAVVLSGEDPRVRRWEVARGRELRFYADTATDRQLNVSDGCFRWETTPLARVADLRLPGAFQRANALAALGIAHALGMAPEQLAAALPTVAGLEHRLEDLGSWGGHRVWDNGVSTTPDSTQSALTALERPLVLLVGGRAKALPLEELTAAVRARECRVVAFGESAELLAAAFRSAGVETHAAGSVEDAVRLAYRVLRPGEELLFSPACASFDAYRNFRDRALAFRRALASLAQP